MTRLSDLVNLIDPAKAGIAWLTIINEDCDIECKCNTHSSFWEKIEDAQVTFIAAVAPGEFSVAIKGSLKFKENDYVGIR